LNIGIFIKKKVAKVAFFAGNATICLMKILQKNRENSSNSTVSLRRTIEEQTQEISTLQDQLNWFKQQFKEGFLERIKSPAPDLRLGGRNM